MTFLAHVATQTGWSSMAGQDGGAVNGAPHEPREPGAEAGGFLSKTRRAALLSRVLQAEILPRLAIARLGAAEARTDIAIAVSAAPENAVPENAASEYDTAELVRLLLGPEDDSAWDFIERSRTSGFSASSLYLGVIAAAARRLGEFWEDDRCDFTQVTISLGRLQRIVRGLSPSFQTAAIIRPVHPDTLLLLPAPGEQHTLGLVILAEFFRREGWHIVGGPVSAGYDAVGLVRDNWLDIAAFSAGSSKGIEALTACIVAVRRASRNRYLGIMVGGPLFLAHPELVTRVGADTTAADAPGAVRQARGLLAMRDAAD